MVQTSDAGVDRIRGSFGGTTIAPGEAEYDAARAVWNGEFDRRPAVVLRCATAAQVADAVRLARAEGLDITVAGGRHNFGGLAVLDGAAMIDLRGLRGVSVDVDARRATVGGGATWADLDGAAQAHGLAVTGGFISHTGVGGLTLGGGMGWLTRRCGLSIDNLLGAEVVTADSRIVRASADENPDLFWALRGGGGNFGIVTSFEFRLHEVGPMAHLGFLFWEVERGTEALRVARRVADSLPSDMGLFIAGLSAPPAPFVPAEAQGRAGIGILVAGFGSAEEHAAEVASMRDELAPLFELVTPIPYAALQQMFDEPNQFGVHGYEKAVYLDALTDEVIALFVEYLPQRSSPLSFVPVFPLSGAYAEVADDGTAFAGSRSSRFGFNIAAVAPDAELAAADRAWVRRFWDALRPHASSSGSYVNFMADIEDERVRASYGAKYDRLAQIKARWDPENVFHHNANIRPAS